MEVPISAGFYVALIYVLVYLHFYICSGRILWYVALICLIYWLELPQSFFFRNQSRVAFFFFEFLLFIVSGNFGLEASFNSCVFLPGRYLDASSSYRNIPAFFAIWNHQCDIWWLTLLLAFKTVSLSQSFLVLNLVVNLFKKAIFLRISLWDMSQILSLSGSWGLYLTNPFPFILRVVLRAMLPTKMWRRIRLNTT